jgi:hypothetical protein
MMSGSFLTEVTMTMAIVISRDVFDYATFGVNLALAMIAIVAVIVAERNVRQAKVSAEASRTAADAAIKSINLNFDVQRPRITVRTDGTSFVTFTMINKGSSPAQILWFNNFPSWHAPVAGEVMGQPRFGAFYDEANTHIMNVPVLHPNAEMEAGTFANSALEEGNPELFGEIRTGGRFLYLYSAIKYKGPFTDQIFETRYCFRLTQNGWRMAGDVGYNFEN